MRRAVATLLVAAAAGLSHAGDATLHGAGATFPFPVYAKWAEAYGRETGIGIGYDAVGSGAGVERLERRLVDFGASDVALTAGELERIGALQFPAVIGGVVPVVNITGLKPGELKLTGAVLASIYLGDIVRWNDARIAGLNPGVPLPASRITVVHRGDASGTSFLWSAFLSTSSDAWRSRVGTGRTLDWPLGVAAVGNEGLASSVQRTRSAIGYVEYAYARQHNLVAASLRNRDGAFVWPGKAAFAAAAGAARWSQDSDLDQLLIDAPGLASWPITAASFVVLPTTPARAAGTAAATRFFDWALSRGQLTAAALDYVPLPDAAVSLVRARWAAAYRVSDDPNTERRKDRPQP